MKAHKFVLSLLFIFLIVLLPSISAFSFTSVEEFTKDETTSSYGKYQIYEKDLFLFTGDLIKEYELQTNTLSCGGTETCYAYFNSNLAKDGTLVDKWNIYNKDSMKPDTMRWYRLEYYGDVIDYKTECIDGKTIIDEKNGTEYAPKICEQVQIGSHKDWIEFKEGQIFKAGNYEWRALGDKAPWKNIEWTFETSNIETLEWATWGNISLGSQAEVILNSPANNSIQYTRLVTTNASANVTGGATLVNATFYDNSTGSWGARNSSSVAFSTEVTNYYKLDESASSTGAIIDFMNVLNGTNSYADNTTGKIQYGYDFNGSGDYINLNGRNANTSSNFSINVWANSDTFNAGLHMIFDTRSAIYNAPIRIYQEGNDIKATTETPASNTFGANFATSPSGWHMYSVVYTAPTKNMSLYYDGSYVSSYIVSSGTATSSVASLGVQATAKNAEYFDGKIDELGIWDTAISTAIITGLYNSGVGSRPYVSFDTVTFTNTYPSGSNIKWNYKFCDSDGACGFATSNYTFSIDSTAPTITLNYPTSIINYGAINQTLQLNLTATDTNLDKVWYNYNGTNITIVGATSGVANLSNITLSTKKNVTIYANDTAGNLNATTFSWDYNFFENNITYNSQTYETSHEMYSLNFNSAVAVLSGTADLYYNGSLHSSTFTCAGLNCNVNSTLDIPLLTGASAQNKSFYWQITTYDGTNSYTFNTTTYIQTVNPLTLTTCASGNVSMNFTAYDEQTRVRLSPFDFQGNFEYYTGLGTIHKDLIISNTSTPYIALCINVNTTYYIDSTITYAAPAYTTQGSSFTLGNATQSTTTVNVSFNYPSRNFIYQKYAISQVTKNVSLLLLGSTSSTNFLFNVLDSALRPVNNVLVETQRCYSGLNTSNNNNITAFMSKTDINGYTSGNLEIYTGQYQFFITNQSNTLLAVTPCAAVSPQSTPYTLTFKLGQVYQSPFTNVENLTDINGSLIYNYTSHQVLMTYIDTSGDFVKAQLLVKLANLSGSTQTTICDTNSTLSSGVITCTISAAGSYTATAYIYRTDRKLVDQITFDYETNSGTLGYYGVFLGMFLLIIGAFAFKFNELAGIWLEFVIIVFCNSVGLIAFGNVFITAYFCLALVISGVLER